MILHEFPTTNIYICGVKSKQQTDILKQPIPTLLVTFAVLLVAQTMRALSHPYPEENLSGSLSPLGLWIDGSLAGFGTTVSLLGMVVSSILITRIITRYSLSVIRSFVPMVLFAVTVGGVLFPIGSPATMLALLMIIHATDQMIMSFKRSECFSEVMRASFWTGLATLIVPDMVYVLALLPVQWLIWQRSLREMIAGTIMALLPLLPCSFCWWVGGKEPLWILEQWCCSLSQLHLPDCVALCNSAGGLPTILLRGLLALLSLLSIVVYLSSFGSMRLRARKGHIYFTLLYLVGVLMLLFGCTTAVAIVLMGYAAVPLIHTFFVRRKGWLSTTIYILLVLIALATAIVPLLQ